MKIAIRNVSDTLFSYPYIVRAKLQKAKTRILQIIREGVKPCRRVFIDYNGLKLMHSWMSDINDSDRMQSLSFRLEILKTLESIPVQDKTKLQDSKVLSTVQRWTTISEYTSKFVRKRMRKSIFIILLLLLWKLLIHVFIFLLSKRRIISIWQSWYANFGWWCFKSKNRRKFIAELNVVD